MASQLVINVPDTVFQPAGYEHLSGAFLLDELTLGPDTYTFDGPLNYDITFQNTGDSVLLTGQVKGSATALCARCLDAFVLPVEGSVECLYIMDAASSPAGLDDDEFDLLPESHEVDILPQLKAALLLEFPLIPLCKDDCLGLCAHCGANLNEGPCACEAALAGDEVPRMSDGRVSPFAVLKDLDLS